MQELAGQFAHLLALPAISLGESLSLPPRPDTYTLVIASIFVALCLPTAWWALLQFRRTKVTPYLALYFLIFLGAAVGVASIILRDFIWIYGLIGTLLILLIAPWLISFSSNHIDRRLSILAYYIAFVFAIVLPLSVLQLSGNTPRKQIAESTAQLGEIAATIKKESQEIHTSAAGIANNPELTELVSAQEWGQTSTWLQAKMIDNNFQSALLVDKTGVMITKAGQSTASKNENLLSQISWLSQALLTQDFSEVATTTRGEVAFTSLNSITPTYSLIVTRTIDQTWLSSHENSAFGHTFLITPSQRIVTTQISPREQQFAYTALQQTKVRADLNRKTVATYTLQSGNETYFFIAQPISVQASENPLVITKIGIVSVPIRSIVFISTVIIVLAILTPVVGWYWRRRKK